MREPEVFAGVPLLETREAIGKAYLLAGCQTLDRDCESVEAELVRLYGKPREHSSGVGAMTDYWKGRRIGIRLDLPPDVGPGKLWVGLLEPVTILRVRPL